ncbi:hypothetical protein H5410_056586 [Solanum commersonii]|uniref:Uncharacterized protein n=1 Tax=Solanum commersonii TaxID=4109 RepID=A0A9J5WMP1_SOLCO|nr:hypothetical protein H5410_056586 [Solanum commersonii]
MTSKIWMTKRSMDYSTKISKMGGLPVTGIHTKISKTGVYPIRASFDHGNGPIYPFGPTGSIAKVLIDVHKIFQQR